MKVLISIVAASVAANVGLVAAFVKQPTLAPPSLRGFFEFGSGGEAAAAKPAARPAKAAPEASAGVFWTRLQTLDLPTLVAQLRAAGFPPAMIRALAEAELQRRFAGRVEEIRRSLTDTPYWQGSTTYGYNAKISEQMTQLQRDRAKALRELLGSDAFAFAGIDPSEAQRRQFGNLSPQKIALVQQVADDYAEMLAQVRGAMQGITLPEDREKLAFLEKSRREDLAGILTPEELADYEMRTSPITSRMRTTFSVMDATEAEYKAIYQAYQPHAELFFPTASGGMIVYGPGMMESRRKAAEEVNATLKQSLGEARFAEYARANDREFQQIYAAGRMENISHDKLVQAFDTRQTASQASLQIANDRNMSSEDKLAALKRIAQESRTTLLSTLGPNAGPNYANAARWLTYLEQGRAFSHNAEGGITLRSITPPRPVAPKKQ